MKFPNSAKLVQYMSESLSQKQIAELLGVSEQMVSSIAKGKAGFPAERVHVFRKRFGMVPFQVAAKHDFVFAWHKKYLEGLRAPGEPSKEPKNEKEKHKAPDHSRQLSRNTRRTKRD